MLANRLSRSGDGTVLVLEKGGIEESLLSSIPLLSQNYYLPQLRAVVRRSEDLTSSSVPAASPFSSGRPWEAPAAGAGKGTTAGGVGRTAKRVIVRTREAVGGATRINAMLHTRGFPGGYEQWRRALDPTGDGAGGNGNESKWAGVREGRATRDWSWTSVEPVFRQLENAVRVNQRVDGDTKDGGGGISAARGTEGEVSVRRQAYAWEHYPFWERSAQALNLPVVRDLNDPTAPSMGYAYLDHLVDDRGFRASAYSMFLPRELVLARRARLAVCTNVVATRLAFANAESAEGVERIVTGVHIKVTGRQGGREFFVKARREVIVCCGTVCTPQLLMLRYVLVSVLPATQ